MEMAVLMVLSWELAEISGRIDISSETRTE